MVQMGYPRGRRVRQNLDVQEAHLRTQRCSSIRFPPKLGYLQPLWFRMWFYVVFCGTGDLSILYTMPRRIAKIATPARVVPACSREFSEALRQRHGSTAQHSTAQHNAALYNLYSGQQTTVVQDLSFTYTARIKGTFACYSPPPPP